MAILAHLAHSESALSISTTSTTISIYLFLPVSAG